MRSLSLVVALCATGSTLAAQDPATQDPATPDAGAQDQVSPFANEVERTISRWVDGYEDERLQPDEDFYGDRAIYFGLFEPGSPIVRYRAARSGVTNERLLEILCRFAASDCGEAGIRGLLTVASTGLERRAFESRARVTRELGLSSLVDAGPDAESMARVALGEFTDDEAEAWRDRDTGVQLAAIEFLVRTETPIRERTMRTLLRDGDDQLRLAAAEALRRSSEPMTLDALCGVVRHEGHPIVAMAALQSIDSIMRRQGAKLAAATRDAVLRLAHGRLGKVSWRTDVQILELIEHHPSRVSVPVLIDLLEQHAPNQLRRVVQRDAVPRLGVVSWRMLQAWTGAILPVDDAAGWRTFWAEHGSEIEIRARRGARPRTTSGFYGVPILGRETWFVIDTSKSMRKQVEDVELQRGMTRLEAAESQLLSAVAEMPQRWKFGLITFSSGVTIWNKAAVRPDQRGLASLTNWLRNLEPGGSTNLLGGMRMALDKKRGDPDEIFVLSDGLPNEGELDGGAVVLEQIRELNRYRKLRINAVFTGVGAGSEFMRKLAEQNGGDFVQR